MREFYDRPLTQTGPARPDGAVALAGGNVWFTHLERLRRSHPPEIIPANDIPLQDRNALSAARAPLGGLTLDQTRLMGVLNTTPDSFSDGGRFFARELALKQAHALIGSGADILDVGGESTRPGARQVAPDEETARTAPLIAELRAAGIVTPISIDTRKDTVARAAILAGASIVNDVSALTHDPTLRETVSREDLPVCLMHAQGDPENMQSDPRYDNVLLDVFDGLETHVRACEDAGIARARILVDPGIGFGKTLEHNLALIRGLSLFHALGCAIVLGVSRKRFIGTIGDEPVAQMRAPGSIALGLEAARQGVQILRVHDIRETKQALALWLAAR